MAGFTLEEILVKIGDEELLSNIDLCGADMRIGVLPGHGKYADAVFCFANQFKPKVHATYSLSVSGVNPKAKVVLLRTRLTYNHRIRRSLAVAGSVS